MSQVSLAPLFRKLDEAEARYAELQESLSDPAVTSNGQRMVAVSKESGKLQPVIEKYKEFKSLSKQLDELRTMLDDREMRELAREELPQVETQSSALLEDLKDAFIAAED